jgi:hypothetical protein
MMGDRPSADEREFFVSYTGADQAWAEWVAWELGRVSKVIAIR